MKKPKVVRKKAGWAITDRKCRLCRCEVPTDKAMYVHHICYDKPPNGNGVEGTEKNDIEVTVNLCWMCHEIVHCRLKFRNPYNKHGRDFAAYYMAKEILRMYGEHPEVIKKIKEG